MPHFLMHASNAPKNRSVSFDRISSALSTYCPATVQTQLNKCLQVNNAKLRGRGTYQTWNTNRCDRFACSKHHVPWHAQVDQHTVSSSQPKCFVLPSLSTFDAVTEAPRKVVSALAVHIPMPFSHDCPSPQAGLGTFVGAFCRLPRAHFLLPCAGLFCHHCLLACSRHLC